MRVYKGNRAALCYKIKKNNMNLKRTRSSCSREREREERRDGVGVFH